MANTPYGGRTGEPMTIEEILALIRSGGVELEEGDPRIPLIGKNLFQTPGSKFSNQALPLQRPYFEPTAPYVAANGFQPPANAPMPTPRPAEFGAVSTPAPPPILARDRAPYRLLASPFDLQPSVAEPAFEPQPSAAAPVSEPQPRAAEPTYNPRPLEIRGRRSAPAPTPPMPVPRPADNIPMPPPRPRSFDAAPSAPAAQAPDDSVSRALWTIYNESQSPADFVRADEAMRDGRAGGGKAIARALEAIRNGPVRLPKAVGLEEFMRSAGEKKLPSTPSLDEFMPGGEFSSPAPRLPSAIGLENFMRDPGERRLPSTPSLDEFMPAVEERRLPSAIGLENFMPSAGERRLPSAIGLENFMPIDRAGGGKVVQKALQAVSELFDSPGMAQWREGSKIPASRVEDRYFTGTSKDKDFANFNVGRHGAWFTKNPEDASMYARENDSKGYRREGWDMVPTNTADRVIPAFLRSENPFTGPLPESFMAENYKKAQSDWFDQLRSQGHDSWMPESDPNLAVILRDPSNIKSAISNSGDFDLGSPRIDRASGGRLLSDQYPTSYMPEVGRQVMADGGGTGNEDIRQYEKTLAEIARQPEDVRMMTHAPSVPMRPIEVEGGLIGKRQLGSAPYNVAGPLSTSAQLAYDMKSLPFYFTPAAPLALASDTAEAGINMAKSINKGDYIGAGIEGALGVAPGAVAFRKPIGKALGVARDALGRVPAPVAAGATGAAVMSPDEAEAGFFGTLARMSAKERRALDLARSALPKGATPAQTWRDYGWAPSPSGSMMSEYSDEAARLLPGGAQMFKQGVSLPAGKLIDNPEMFGRYPSHFSAQIQSLDPAAVAKGERGWYDHYRDVSGTNRGMTDDEILDNILHEIGGHRTQKIEGFSAGTSPSMFRGPDTWEIEQSLEQIEGAKPLQRYLAENPGSTLGDALFDLKKMGVELPSGASTYARTPDLDVLSAQKKAQLEKVKSSSPSAYEQYFRSEGEVNARLPGERRGMSESQRRENFPWQNPDRIFIRDPYQRSGGNPDDPAWSATQAAIDFARKLGNKGGGSVGLLDSVSPSAIMSQDGRDPYQSGGVIRKALGLLKPAGSGYKSVPGKPETVNIPGFGKVEARPVPEIEKAAADYMKSIGRPGEHTVSEFKPLNEEYAVRVADAFERMKHSPGDPEVRRSYEALMDETMAQYRAAKDTGIDFKFMKEGQADPYAASPALGYEDIVNRGRLWVYPTEQGFGSTDSIVASNPLVKGAGRVGDKPDAVVNDAFRVIHDLYGHYGPGNPFFRAPGEERAYQLHSRMFSPEALPAATAETRGQNSWVNYGPYGDANRRALGSETVFADQKTGMMPSWTTAEPPPVGSDVDAYIRSLEGRAEGGAVNKEEPGLVDRAMSFLSQFNPVGSAEAGPISKQIAKQIAKQVMGAGVGHNGGPPMQTLYSDLSKNKHVIPVEEMSAGYVPTHQMLPRKIIDPQKLQGSELVNAVGDRTMAGQNLIEINGVPLAYPVSLEGGPDFMRALANQRQGAVWASDPAVIKSIAKFGKERAEETGKDVNFVYSSMGARAGDFSHMMSDAILAQMQGRPFSKDALEALNKVMYQRNSKWPGLLNTDEEAIQRARDVILGNGPMRKQFAEEVALGNLQGMGFPDIGSTRYAITEPAMIGKPTGASGYAISRLDPAGRWTNKPEVPHTTYPSQMIEGEYKGGLELQVPREIMFPDFYKQRRLEGRPQGSDDRSFSLSRVSQDANQEWLDNLMKWTERSRRSID